MELWPMAHIVVFLLGTALVIYTLVSAIRTFVLPRGANVFLTRIVFRGMRSLFWPRVRLANSFEERDKVMALYAPLSLVALPAVWLGLVLAGYMAMFWALGVHPWVKAFLLSGSSLLTLGFAPVNNLFEMVLAFSEATIGLGLMALLIAYLPTMYAAFSRRETAVALLAGRAGTPPSAVEWIKRAHRVGWVGRMNEQWATWEGWFTELEESHTSLAPLVFFRSPHPGRSWVTAAGAVLDTAALTLAAVDVPYEFHAALCIRTGFLSLRRIADFFQVPYKAAPHFPEDPISIEREEFDEAYAALSEAGVPVKVDRDQAWRDFAGWRVNYDTVLLALAALTDAPYAPWSSDRSVWQKQDSFVGWK